LLKFIFIAATSLFLDYGLLFILKDLISIEIALFLSFFISSIYNFLMNYFFTFKSTKNIFNSTLKYYTLVFINSIITVFLTIILLKIFDLFIAKTIVVSLLFISNYIISKKTIF